MNEQQSIQIIIADRAYQFKIAPNEEERVRLAVKMINERVERYKGLYAKCDNQNALAMTVLQFVIKLMETEESKDASKILEEMKSLDNQLEEYIQKNIT